MEAIQLISYIKEDVAELVEFCASSLNMNNIKLVIMNNDKILDMFSTSDVSLQALLNKTNLYKTYQLMIRSNSTESIETLICHEMIHLSQYESNRLKLDMDKKEFTWLGKKYENSYPYMDRPWEKEAFSKQSSLLREWKKHQREVKKSQKKCKLFGK